MSKRKRNKLIDNVKRYHELAVSCNQSKSGFNWYENYNKLFNSLSASYNIPIEKTVGVSSALSPSIPWNRAVQYTQFALSNQFTKVKCYTSQIDKAKAILNLPSDNKFFTLRDTTLIPDILHGNKTVSFYYNLLLEDTDHVTLDRHAIRIIYDIPKNQSNLPLANSIMSNKNKYEKHCDVYRSASNELGYSKAYQLQAITWDYFTKHGYKQLCFNCNQTTLL